MLCVTYNEEVRDEGVFGTTERLRKGISVIAIYSILVDLPFPWGSSNNSIVLVVVNGHSTGDRWTKCQCSFKKQYIIVAPFGTFGAFDTPCIVSTWYLNATIDDQDRMSLNVERMENARIVVVNALFDVSLGSGARAWATGGAFHAFHTIVRRGVGPRKSSDPEINNVAEVRNDIRLLSLVVDEFGQLDDLFGGGTTAWTTMLIGLHFISRKKKKRKG